MEKIITLDTALSFTKPTEDFLVKLDDNTYGVRFKGFKIRDCDSNEIYHDFKADDIYQLDYFADNELSYLFPHRLLKAKTIGSNLTLVVGSKLVPNLDLVERHFIDDKLVAHYQFNFPVFLPNSENNIEFLYPVPKLSDETREKLNNGEDIIAKSDTFIFVNGKLIIHRRANYTYSDF